MTYTELLTVAAVFLSFDGWLIATYMFLAALIATFMNLKPQRRLFFTYWFLGLLVGLFGSYYSDAVIEARLPYAFMFCLGVVGVGLGLVGLLAITFSPSIFAFNSHMRRRKLMLAANVPMLFPFGPVILFFFVLKDFRDSLATIPGDPVQTVLT